MKLQSQTQCSQSAEINFLHAGTDIKGNATQMAKIFEKKIEAFTRNEDIQKRITRPTLICQASLNIN